MPTIIRYYPDSATAQTAANDSINGGFTGTPDVSDGGQYAAGGGAPSNVAFDAAFDSSVFGASVPGLASVYTSGAPKEIFDTWTQAIPNGFGPPPTGYIQATLYPGTSLVAFNNTFYLYPAFTPTNLSYFADSAAAGANISPQTSLGGNYPSAGTAPNTELIAYHAAAPPYFYLQTTYTPGPGKQQPLIGWQVYGTATVVAPNAANPNLSSDQRLYPVWTNAPTPVICFREGSTILVHENGEDVRKPVETLRPGALVKTLKHGYLPISVIGHSQIYNPANAQRSKNRLYKLTQEKYPELTSDLYVTGCHSILVDSLTTTQEEEIREDYNTIFVTDKKFRLPAYLDEKAEPFAEEGNFTIWHFALEGDDERKNHGIYANGLLVESSFKKHVESRGGMTLVE